MGKTVSVNLNLPKISTQPQLENIIERIIRPDIQKKMQNGVDINGSPHRKNARSTVVNRGLRGLKTAVPLIASGQLRSSFRINLVGDNAVRLFPAGLRNPYPKIKKKYRLTKRKSKKQSSEDVPTNQELAVILQKEGVKATNHKYEFFGISEEAEDKSLKFMIRYINKAIRDGKRRTVR